MKRFLPLFILLTLLSGCTQPSANSSMSSESEERTSSSQSSNSETSSETSSSESSSETANVLDPLDEQYIAKQYYLNHIGNIFDVWRYYTGKGVTIAVIDVGFNPYHEDFINSDGNSKISSKSASFSYNGTSVSTKVGVNEVVNMGESHGTFCAGVAAASLNSKGVVGIAYDADLLLLKTDLKPRSIAAAFKYAADNGARVITISIGSYYDYGGDLVNDGSDLATVFEEPINYCYNKGVVICSAAGNGGLEDMPTEYTFPGCYPHVIGVGGLAFNSSSEIWSGSSYNSSSAYQFADVFAPAENMFGMCHYDGKLYDGGWQGTSFASPIVAGLAALYFEKNPTRTNVNFENDLYNACSKITKSSIATSDQLGYGRVNARRLLGISSGGNITVKLKTNWSMANAYVWNSYTGATLKAWPGNALSKSLTLNVDLGEYDSIIFNDGSGNQTIDLSLSAFINEKTYDISGNTKEAGLFVGRFL